MGVHARALLSKESACARERWEAKPRDARNEGGSRIPSRFQFAKRFYVNTTYREQFHESMWRRLEKHLSS